MRVPLVVAFLVVAVHSIAASAQPNPSPLQGDWVGGFTLEDYSVELNLHLSGAPDSLGGTADVAPTDYESQRAIPLNAVTLKNSAFHCEAPTRWGNFVFEGTLKGREISGTYRQAERHGTFGVTRVAGTTPEDREKLFGLYEAKPRGFVSVFDYGGTNLRFVDYESGQQNTLFPLANDDFFGGPGQAMSFPRTLDVRFVKDGRGRATSLLYRFQGGPQKTARRVDATEEQLTVRNGDVTLSGTLITPVGKGPHPVIVIVPGDFGSSRDGLRGYAGNFLRRGVAALIFDSRGAGGSTGPRASSSFGDLANDVLAWVALLRARAGLDSTGIGLFGFSNSAWTVTLAASRSRQVAFLVSQSVSAFPPWQQELYRAERQIRLAGFPDTAVQNAVAFMKLKFEVARTGTGWEELQAMRERHQDEGWFPYTNPPSSLERLKAYWDRSFSYDPEPAFEQVTCPTLVIFGGLDSNVSAAASIPVIERALQRAGNKDYTVKVFATGRHDLVEGEDGGPKEFRRMKRFPPGYWRTMADWVVARAPSRPQR